MDILTYIFNLVKSELLTSFSWLGLGFLGTIVLLIIIGRIKPLKKKTSTGKIMRVVYYIIFPIMIGISAWIFAATKSVNKTIDHTVDNAIEQVEAQIYPSFHSFFNALVTNFLSGKVDEFPSNDEMVVAFMEKEGIKTSGAVGYTTKWILVKSLEYIEDKVLEESANKLEIEEESLKSLLTNHPEASVVDKAILDVPFKRLSKEISFFTTSALGPYYFISYILFFYCSNIIDY